MKGGGIMKRIIAILVVVSMVSALSITTLAAGSQATSQATRLENNISALKEKQQKIADKMTEIQAKQQAFATKKAEFAAFRTALLEKKSQMLVNMKANITLTQANKQLRQDISNSLIAIKQSGTKLSDETVAKFKDYNAQIKDILAGMKETKDNIKDILTKNKEYIKSKDYVSMDSAFEAVYTIQEWRNGELQKVNGILQEMIKLMASEV